MTVNPSPVPAHLAHAIRAAARTEQERSWATRLIDRTPVPIESAHFEPGNDWWDFRTRMAHAGITVSAVPDPGTRAGVGWGLYDSLCEVGDPVKALALFTAALWHSHFEHGRTDFLPFPPETLEAVEKMRHDVDAIDGSWDIALSLVTSANPARPEAVPGLVLLITAIGGDGVLVMG